MALGGDQHQFRTFVSGTIVVVVAYSPVLSITRSKRSLLYSVPRAPPRNVEAVFNATMAHISWEPPKVFPGEIKNFSELHALNRFKLTET